MANAAKETTSSSPWRGQQPYLKQLYAGASDLLGQGNYEYGPGRVSGTAPETEEAWRMAADQARQGSPTLGMASAEAQKTLSGDYLNPESNPWLQKTHDIGKREIERGFFGATNALGSRLEGSNRSGSGAAQLGRRRTTDSLAQGLGDFTNQLYGGNYQAERGRMSGMVGQAAGLEEARYRDATAMGAIGQQRQQESQRQIDDIVARFLQTQHGTQQKLAEFSSLIGKTVMASQGKSSSWGVL